jgi:filamentous hemagglutinin
MFKEEYLPGPGGGRLGSNWLDITAVKNGRTLRINTIDTLADGITPTAREAAAAASIRAKALPGEHLLLIPKPK